MTDRYPENRDRGMRAMLWRCLGRHVYRMTFHNWYGLRQRILTLFGARLGPNTKFRRTVEIDRPWNLSAGELTMVGDGAVFRARERISIGDRAVVSQLATLSTEMRDPRQPAFTVAAAPITLEDDTWIAADCLVLPGSVVKKGTVVGARSLVRGELPEWTIAAGEPATPRRTRRLR